MINIDDVIKLIENLPLLMSYIVPGYCALVTYRFLMGKSYSTDKNRLIESIVISYLSKLTIGTLCNKWEAINEEEHIYRFTIVLVIVSVLISAIYGFICKCEKVNEVLLRSIIGRSFNENFWADVMKQGVWYRVHLKNGDVVYEGQITKMEEQCRTPYIELSAYRVLNKEQNRELANYNQFSKRNMLQKGEKRSIIINTASIDYISVIDTREM